MTNKEDEYKVIEWQQSSLLENATTNNKECTI